MNRNLRDNFVKYFWGVNKANFQKTIYYVFQPISISFGVNITVSSLFNPLTIQFEKNPYRFERVPDPTNIRQVILKNFATRIFESFSRSVPRFLVETCKMSSCWRKDIFSPVAAHYSVYPVASFLNLIHQTNQEKQMSKYKESFVLKWWFDRISGKCRTTFLPSLKRLLYSFVAPRNFPWYRLNVNL